MTVSPTLACQIDDYQGNRLLPWTSRRQPLPNLNAQSTAGLGVRDEKSLGFVNFVGNRQYITLGNLSENTKAHAAISRGRRCHLSQLDTRGKMSPSQRRAICHGPVRDFFAEADISKLITFAIFR
jgi:hypothetical protein